MDALRRFGAIVAADLLERSRSLRFWTTLGLVGLASWWFFPPADALYMSVALNGNHRGLYSSAWVGMVLAMIFSTLLSLVGFYLVRGTLARDIETRVWQLLVATPLTRSSYLFAKWCSHLLVLGLIVLAGLAVGLAAQLVRGEDAGIDLVEMVKPVLLLSVPALALAATFAILFDLLPWLRRTAGNILYFFIWAGLLSLSMMQVLPQHKPGPLDAWIGDPGGVIVFVRSVERLNLPELGGPRLANMNVGRPNPSRHVETFTWKAWHPRLADLRTGALWLMLAGAGVALGARMLDWAAMRTGGRPAAGADGSGRRLRWLGWVLRPLQRSPLGALVAVELQLALRQRGLGWWLMVLASMGVQLAAPPAFSAFALLAAWMLLLDLFGNAALREYATRTGGLVFSAAGGQSRILAARWVMLVVLAWVFTLPGLLRLAGVQAAAALAVLVLGVSLASWGLALGALTRNARTFELLACVLAYLSLNGMPALQVTAAPSATLAWHAAALPLAAALLALAWPRLNRE